MSHQLGSSFFCYRPVLLLSYFPDEPKGSDRHRRAYVFDVVELAADHLVFYSFIFDLKHVDVKNCVDGGVQKQHKVFRRRRILTIG